MRKRIRIAAAVTAAVLMTASGAGAMCLDPLADYDGNGSTDVVDVTCTMLGAFYSLLAEGESNMLSCLDGDLWRADLDCGGGVDVLDVQLAIAAALDQPLGASNDANGDGCPDLCELDPEPGASLAGAPWPAWSLLDFQPVSSGFETTYGLDALPEGVTVVALLASW